MAFLTKMAKVSKRILKADGMDTCPSQEVAMSLKMAMAKPVLLLRSPEIMSHLEHSLHELEIMLNPIYLQWSGNHTSPHDGVDCVLPESGRLQG